MYTKKCIFLILKEGVEWWWFIFVENDGTPAITEPLLNTRSRYLQLTLLLLGP